MDDRIAKWLYEDNFLVRLQKSQDDISLLQKLSVSAIYEAIYDLVNGLFTRSDGWIPTSWASPTRVSATVFTVAEDVTSILKKGYKLKATDTTTKYFLVLSVSFGAGVSTITTVATSDYAFVGNPSNISYSNIESPFGYPSSFNYAGVASPSSGAFSGSPVVEAKFSAVAGLMYISFRINLTTAIINTGTGELRMEMPVNANAAVVANGRENAVIGGQLQGFIASASNLCRIFTYNNNIPMVNNYQIYMNVTMMW
jgi:hypothetical protein